ncbi:MAG: hypothetical protein ACTSRP_15725 [Candidatus Helarchaeota archaeon]
MSENHIPFRGISISISFYKNTHLDLNRTYNTLKRQQFKRDRGFGILELKISKTYLQFKYLELLSKNLEVFENDEITFKTILFPKYCIVILFKDNSIFIGSNSFIRKAVNKLKNLLNIEFLPILKNDKAMRKIYHDFFKVYQLDLIENDENAFVKNLKLKGDLSEDSYWKEYSSNRFLSEIYGKFEIDEIIYRLKIKSNCSCIIYKSGDSFPIKSIIWLRDYLKNY